MKTSLFILLFCILFIRSDVKVIHLESKPEIFTSDIFDHIYVSQKNVIKKFDLNGKLISKYGSGEFGRLHSMDVSDPMRILLFYKEFNTISFLDKQLNLLGTPIMLDKLGFSSAGAVGVSRINGIWVFDQYSKKLIQYSFDQKRNIREIDIQNYVGQANNIESIIESGNEIYLHSPDKNPLVFNYIGGKMKTIDILPQTGLQVINDNLIYTNKKRLFRHNMKTGLCDSTFIDGFEELDDMRLGTRKIIVLRADSICIRHKPTGF